MVNGTLNLISGNLSPISGGSIDLGPGGTIVVTNGHLMLGSGGSIGLVSLYNVTYDGNSTMSGLELTGAGLNDVTVNVNTLNTITLVNDLSVQGRLWLNSGVLALAGHDLTLNGTIHNVGNGRLASSNLSNLTFNTVISSLGAIMFNGTASALHNLTVNVGTGYRAHVTGQVTVAGNLQLNTGTFDISNADVRLTGTISGNGNMMGNSGSDLEVSLASGTSTAIGFETGGQMLRDLRISLGTGTALTLLSDLTISGQLNLSGGSNLGLNGHTVIIGTGGSVIGSGLFLSNAQSNLTIDATGGIPSLKVAGTVGNLRINTSNQSTVALGSSLVVDGTLTMESGILNLNAKDLTLNGNIGALGSGTVSSTEGSDITVAMSSSSVGALGFTSGFNTVGQFNVSVLNQGRFSIGSDLNISSALLFSAGKLDMGDHTLHMNIESSISGITPGSYIITGPAGGLERNVTAGGSTSVKFPIGTSDNYSPAEAHFNTGSVSGFVRIKVSEGVLVNGVSGADIALTQPAVNATWYVSSDVTGIMSMNLQVMWPMNLEVNGFNRINSYLSHFVNAAWDVRPYGDATVESNNMFSLQRTDLNSFSPFAVFDNTSITPVEEVSTLAQFEIYPNPATESITVRNNSMLGEAVIMELFDSSGQLIGTRRLTDTAYIISLIGMTPGNYIMKFSTETMTVSHTFVKM
jgi:hypothetical protein